MRPFMKTVLAKTVAAILAATVVGMFAALRGPVLRVFGRAWSQTRLSVNWLFDPLPAPRILVIGLLVVAFSLAARRLRSRAVEELPAAPSPRDYREDAFLGLVWRWTYDSSGQPRSVYPFCPQCDLQLQPGIGLFHMTTELHCDRCRRELLSCDQDWPNLQARIVREIQRALRTGEWRSGRAGKQDADGT
jgi:hypothetical protein